MKKIKKLTTLEEVKVFSDPYRIQIMNHFYEMDIPATVKQIADRMGEVPAKVHYHVKKLEKAGLLELVKTEEIKGIMAKYYEPTACEFIISRSEVKNLNASNRRIFLGETEKAIHQQFQKAEEIFIKQIYVEKEEDDATPGETDGEHDEMENATGFMNAYQVYMTKQEAIAFNKMVKEYMEEKGRRKKEKDQQEYYFFSTIIEMKDNQPADQNEKPRGDKK